MLANCLKLHLSNIVLIMIIIIIMAMSVYENRLQFFVVVILVNYNPYLDVLALVMFLYFLNKF